MADLEQLDPLDPEAYSWGEADAATKAQVSTATAPVTGDMLTSSAIQARFSSATAPVTSDEMIGAYVGTPVMTDADAAREWEAYPYYDEDQRRLADAKFDVFFDRQDKVRERENYDVLKNQLLNPDAKKAFYQSPEALDIAQRLKNPNDLWNQRVVTNFLENVMKRPLEEGEYEGAKNKWIAQGMNGQFEIDDAGAVSTLTKQMELDGEQGEAGVEAHKEIMLGLAEELLGGKPYQIGDTFDKLRKGHPEVFRNRESSMYQSVYDEAEKIKSLIGRNPDAVRLPLSYLIKAESQLMAPEEELRAARNALLNVSPEDRQIVLDFVVDAAKAKLVDPGDLKRGMRELGDVGRGITNSLDDLNQLKDELATHEKMGAVKEGHARVAPDGQWVYTPVAAVAGLRVPTSKESAEQLSELVAEQNFIKASRDLKGAYRRAMKLGTVANEDWLGGVPAWLERGTVGFAANLPNMALYALGGPIGTIGYTLTVGSSYANDALLKNPRMDARVAAAGGWLGAAAEGYFELINWKMFTGGVELKQLYTTLKSSGLEVMLKKLTGQFLGEQGVEGIQDFTGAATMKFVQLIARDLGMGEDQTGKIETWQKIVKDWWEERPEVMGQVLIGSLIGAGIMTHEHLKDPDRTLYNERTLAGTWQMSPEQTDKILNAPSKEARDKAFMRYAQSMTDEQVAASIVYQQDQVQQATGAAISTDENPRATLATEMVDGKRVWHVLDENGERVRENLPADVALTELSAYQELIDKERFEERAREETAVSDVQKQVGAEIVWEALKPEQKTTAQNIFEFSYAEKTPEQEAKLARLQEAVNVRTERLGIPGDEIELVDVDMPQTRAGRGAINFIRWYEGTFGKSVQFVASKTDQPLSFTGLALPSDPNTIFLDAQGDRNILSLLGHEWSHTLEHSNPALWGSIVTQLKPLVVDWAKQLGKISPTYTADQATPEFIANVIGDAFSTPEFWDTVRAKEPNIFKRMVEAIMEWFDVQIDRASEWGTEAPDVISDLKAMREIIANAMKEAQQGPEVTTTEEFAEAEFALPRPLDVYSKDVVESFRRQDEERRQDRAQDQAVRTRLVESINAYWRVEGFVRRGSRGGLEGDHGQSEERSRELERYVSGARLWPDQRVVDAFGFANYDLNGLPRPQNAFPAPPPDLLVYTDKKATAKVGYDLARDLDIRAGEIPRAELHDAIVRFFLAKGDASMGRLAFLSGGGGGSGKSTLMAKREGMTEEGKKGYVHIDADEIRKYLPEYRVLTKMDDSRAANITHEESSGLTKRIFSEARAAGFPILYDATFANPKKNIPGIINPLLADGYRVRMMGVIIHPYEALARAFVRAKKSKRYVPAEMLLEAHKGYLDAVAVRAYQNVLGMENVVVYDNTAITAKQEAKPSRVTYTPFAGQAAERRGHKFTERGEREVDEKGGYIERAEKDLITQKIHAWLDEKKVPAGAYRDKLVKDTRRQVESDIKSRRALNPDASTGAADPWSRMDVTGVEMEFVTAKEGEKPLTKGGAAWQKQSYQFEKPPEGFTPETWRTELARRVVGQFITQLQTGEKKDVALIVKELEWYRDFTDRLRADFGGAAEFMVDLMGAFSPRQNVQLNWRNAIDAIWGISTGKYDVLLKELDAYLKADPAHTIKTWRDQGGAVIRARSGALMGTNTDLGMTAALGLWREVKFGDAPKAKNFTRNLIGLSIKATIDVWAARLLDRVGGKPRIPVDAEKGVQGSHIVSERQLWKEFGPEYLGELPVKGQFAFGQGVFEDVAAMMRDPATWAETGIPQEIVDAFANVTPADVQATNWFVEKRIWTKNNWTNEEGAGGSFIHEIENLVGSRFQVGLSQAIGNRPGYADFIPTDPEQERFTAEVRQDLINRLPDVIAMRVKSSLGMFMDTRERSTDLELTHGPGMEPNDLMRTVLYHAWSKEQQSTHISRVMDPWEEDRSNARPGLEIYFKEVMEERVIQPILDLLGTRDINGFTFIVDPRAEMGEGRYLGVRFQYIPEYSGDGPEWTKNAEEIRTKLADMHREILMMPGVATVRQEEYDTVVFQEGIDYDADGVNAGAIGTSQAALWRRRYFDAVALKATYRNEAELAAERLAAESDILNRQQTKAAKGLAPPKKKGKAQVTITAFDPALMGFAEQSVTPSVTLLHQLRAERDAYNALLKCLS